MLTFDTLKKRANALDAESVKAISMNEAIIIDSLKASEKFALVRFSELAKAVDNKLSVMRLSIDVDYCKDDRLSLFYLVSNDEKKSYIVKMYLSNAQRENAIYYIYAHARLAAAAADNELLASLKRDSKSAFVCESNQIVDVLKAFIALSK